MAYTSFRLENQCYFDYICLHGSCHHCQFRFKGWRNRPPFFFFQAKHSKIKLQMGTVPRHCDLLGGIIYIYYRLLVKFLSAQWSTVDLWCKIKQPWQWVALAENTQSMEHSKPGGWGSEWPNPVSRINFSWLIPTHLRTSHRIYSLNHLVANGIISFFLMAE